MSSPLTESAPYLVHPKPREPSPAFYQFYYNSSVDYTLPANILPNGGYGQNAHPSEVALAYDTVLQASVFVDSVLPLSYANENAANASNGTSPALYYAKSVSAGSHLPVGTSLAEHSTVWGYSTCHWIRQCNAPTESVGSPCQATLSGVTYQGFCFESSTGTLECGHATAFDTQDASKPMAVGTARSPNVLPNGQPMANVTVLPQATYRCERGTPAQSAGAYVGKRLLIAGCMISSDPDFSELAEVHVPEYCASPTPFRTGCMIPTATNFDPLAKQPTDCHYRTMGCTSSSALNYNSEASIDDGSCIVRKFGCTVAPASYAGVASDTPGYRSGFYGSAGTNVGKISETAYNGPAVTNYDPTANVRSGCIVAIEGCMDPSATNYNPQATVDTDSWCIPPVPGCMRPSAALAGPQYSPPAGNWKDGLTNSFNPAATVHVPSMCTRERHGCMVQSVDGVPMLNYDAYATVPSPCYPLLRGCLNPQALNVGCEAPQGTPCPNSNVTIHLTSACVWSTPPAAPRPSAPPGGNLVVQNVVQIGLTASGSVSDYDETAKDSIKDKCGALSLSMPLDPAARTAEQTAELAALTLTIDVTAGSVLIIVNIRGFQSPAAASSASASFSSSTSSVAAASAALGITVLSVPRAEATTILVAVDAPSPPPDSSSSETPVGAIVGGSVGGFLLLALIAVGVVVRMRRRREAATVHVEDPASRRQADGGDYGMDEKKGSSEGEPDEVGQVEEIGDAVNDQGDAVNEQPTEERREAWGADGSEEEEGASGSGPA